MLYMCKLNMFVTQLCIFFNEYMSFLQIEINFIPDSKLRYNVCSL